MLIGLTGRIASGKGEVAKYFVDKGFIYISLSDSVRKEAEKMGIDFSTEIGRKNLQDLGNSLRRQKGTGIWARKILEEINLSKNYIIDGIRNPAEINELMSVENFYLISVNAPFDIRWKRVLQRAKASDPKTKEEFKKADDRDFGIGEPVSGQQVGTCMAMANFKLENNGSLNELYDELEKICEEIKC